MDKRHKAIAKVIAKVSSGEFEVINLNTQPISFKLSDTKVEYKVRKTMPNQKQNYIDTDEDETSQNIQEISISKGESYTLIKK